MAIDKTHKIRAKMQQGRVVVKLLIRHPMETGNRKQPLTGGKIPRHFIREIHCRHNDRTVLTGFWSSGMASNPYLSFHLQSGKKGDSIRCDWVDNLGLTDAIETRIS
ncbi:MAG: thiosulfate oxidation carrier complex protein SoxZ [Gammaproteobacteria bacterium]|nr:thiosulfate oxidation carrier complex protein SoxZ [Gammaproteobacteria bacterium]